MTSATGYYPGIGHAIHFFDGTKFDFLSNFHPSPITWRGADFDTVEHAYQAAKAHKKKDFKAIAEASSPGKAKRMGQSVLLRKDWDEVKFVIMHQLVRQKFLAYPELREKLLATRGKHLIEGNTWGDKIWGCIEDPKTGLFTIGANHLGHTLMLVRSELILMESE